MLVSGRVSENEDYRNKHLFDSDNMSQIIEKHTCGNTSLVAAFYLQNLYNIYLSGGP